MIEQMKTGVTLSSAAHIAILAFGLFSFGAPEQFDVAPPQAISTDIIPLSEFTEAVQGAKDAPLEETSAPKPSEKPQKIEDAINVGAANVDNESNPDAEPAPNSVKTVEERTSEEDPAETLEKIPVPIPKPRNEVVEVARAEEAAKAAKAAEEAAEKVVEEEQAKAKAEAEALEQAEADKKAQEVEQAKKKKEAEEAKKLAEAEKKKKEAAKLAAAKKAKEQAAKQAAAKKKAKKKNDDLAALINKEKNKGDGAKRSNKKAALGTKKGKGQKLSANELDALRGQLSDCWSVPIGIIDVEALRASVKFKLDVNGELEGRPRIIKSSGNNQFDRSAVRAVQKCNQQGFNLPANKQEIWADVIVNFDPAEMF